MSFQIKTKKKIPSEAETRQNILTTAMIIGCKEQVKNIFRFYDGQFEKEKKDSVAVQKIAESFITDLYKLDQRLVGWLINENGEIVVGNKVIIKVTTPMNIIES